MNQENIDTDAIPGLLADTDSVLAERYRNLTRFEKLQYQFQSPQYEMVIFSAVYLNVCFDSLEMSCLPLFEKALDGLRAPHAWDRELAPAKQAGRGVSCGNKVASLLPGPGGLVSDLLHWRFDACLGERL